MRTIPTLGWIFGNRDIDELAPWRNGRSGSRYPMATLRDSQGRNVAMEMTRRGFVVRTSSGIAAIAASGALTGCSAGNVFTDIENWIPVGVSAIQGIVSLLNGSGLITPPMQVLVTAILTGFDDLLADVKTYEALNPPPTGALAKIEEVFSLIVGNIQMLLAQVGGNSPVIATVIGLAQVILSTIAGFLGDLPVTTKSLRLSGTFQVGSQNVTYKTEHRTIRKFKRDYNAVANAGGHPEIDLHLSLLEHF